VIIQEGVLTAERINEAVAEPVVYTDGPLRGGRLLPGACRAWHRREPEHPRLHLRAAGFCREYALTSTRQKPGASAPNRFYMYGVIGRLAMLAASYELEATDPEAESYD
jgi:glutamate--cysteine ligase